MRILLLREEGENDKYRSRFEDNGFNDITQIPVLDFTFCNLEKLKNVAEHLLDYSGLIFTSKRAVDAFVQVIGEKIIKEIKDENFPIYVVGISCEEYLQEHGFSTLGRDTGNSHKLAALIASQHDVNSKPLVFACGNLACDTIPKILNEQNISLVTVMCYCTTRNENFLPLFKEYISNGMPQVIVFFSPSGAEFYLADIEKLIVDVSVLIVCIGKTTQSAILKLGKEVNGVAAKPNAMSLVESIKSL